MHGKSSKGYAFVSVILFFVYMLALTIPVWAAGGDPSKDVRVPFENLEESIDQTLLQEKEVLSEFQKELIQAKDQERIYKAELAAMKVQYSVYSNLVIMPESQVKSLEQAYTGNLSVLDVIQNALSSLKYKKDRIKTQQSQTEEQIRLNSKQLQGIVSDKKNQPRDSLKLVEKLKSLLDILNTKKTVVTKLSEIYEADYNQYSDMGGQFKALSEAFDKEIKNRKKQSLLKRKQNVLFSKSLKDMALDLGAVLTSPRVFFSRDYWTQSLGLSASTDYSALVIMSLTFVFLQYVLYRVFRRLRQLRERPFFQHSSRAGLTVTLMEKSLFLTGNLLFILICDYFYHIHLKFPIVELVEQALTTLLLSRWAIDFLKQYPHAEGRFPQAALLKPLIRMVRAIRYFSLVYIAALWIIEPDNVLLVFFRMGFAILFYVQLVHFRYVLAASVEEAPMAERSKHLLKALPVTGYIIMFAGLITDLSGYVTMAFFVAVSLVKSLLALMWSGLVFRLLLDYKHAAPRQAETTGDDLGMAVMNAHWFSTLIYALAWFVFSLVALIYVWGGKQAVIQGIYTWYTKPFTVGSMQFSLMGFSVALLFLVGTHLLAKAWRELFQKRLLHGSGMDIGVQDSITTISVYLIWTAGILLALNVFGLNMTSITVVLGALGIGIGFGLQNIFNNFLSGIILLFERPIQVGDDVEINGTWANVRKINVRSTVVQTYDNATLIIPNSDFISSQVTNWSFKDKRIRRNITVGVAYGSDLEKVRSSMIEAAEITPRVLKLPKPDVIFLDFGDNALIFKLRIWTRVEYFYSVESLIRFEIDRLFRERNIEISFPQRDLHIRSVDADLVFNHATLPSSKALETKKE